jgi:hypothetical protein
MAPAVSWEKNHLNAGEDAGEERVGRRAPRRWRLDPAGIFKPIDVIEA